MAVTIRDMSNAINGRMTANQDSDSIKVSWQKGLDQVQSLRSSGRFDTANRHPMALSSMKDKTGIAFSSLGEFEENIKAQQKLTDQHFKGDARAMADFVKQNGNNPAIAGRDFNDWVKSGDASKFIQQQQAPATAGPGVAPISVAAVPATAAPTGPSINIDRPQGFDASQGRIADMIFGKDIPMTAEGLAPIRQKANDLRAAGVPMTEMDKFAVKVLQGEIQKDGSEAAVRESTMLGKAVDPMRPMAIGRDGKPVGSDRPEVQTILQDLKSGTLNGQQTSMNQQSQGLTLQSLSSAFQPNKPSDLMASRGPLFDRQGRLDLNGDGIGGVAGLIVGLVQMMAGGGAAHSMGNNPQNPMSNLLNAMGMNPTAISSLNGQPLMPDPTQQRPVLTAAAPSGPAGP